MGPRLVAVLFHCCQRQWCSTGGQSNSGQPRSHQTLSQQLEISPTHCQSEMTIGSIIGGGNPSSAADRKGKVECRSMLAQQQQLEQFTSNILPLNSLSALQHDLASCCWRKHTAHAALQSCENCYPPVVLVPAARTPGDAVARNPQLVQGCL